MSIFHRLLFYLICGATILFLFPEWPATNVVSSNSEMMEIVTRMNANDHHRPTISVTHWPHWLENLPQLGVGAFMNGNAGSVHMIKPVSFGLRSAVYSVESDPTKVVVYRQSCDVDRGLVEFWMLEYLQPSGVVPSVLGVSRKMEVERVLKKHDHTKGKLGDQIESCPDNTNLGHVRYILMERAAGDAISNHLKTRARIPLDIATTWMIHLVIAIGKMHRMNVVHGAVTMDNIVVSDTREFEIKLIDFHQAKIYNREETLELSERSCGESVATTDINQLRISSSSSFWESQQCARSFRDDMFQTLLVYAAMIHGEEYMDFQNCISEIGEVEPELQGGLRSVWVQHRTEAGAIFETGSFDRTELPTDCRSQFKVSAFDSVVSKLTSLSSMVLSLSLHDQPDYYAMVRVLTQILRETSTRELVV